MRSKVNRRRLPIGINDFRTIREGDFYYVDKTPLIRRLVDRGWYYFLSRPRRFGKSLLVSTLESLFECDEELFRGLDIHDHWDWSKPHPVVRLSFDGSYREPSELDRDIIEQLERIERRHDLGHDRSRDSGQLRLCTVLHRLHRATGRSVVVLVDGHDRPALGMLDQPELAKANWEHMCGVYGIIKDSYDDVDFVFVTGESMLSTAGPFSSGLNNLIDISLDPRNGTICGFTEDDLDRVFAPELSGLDRDEIRKWYNGYHWLGDERVYNPFDLLSLFKNREFKPYWFDVRSPTSLFEKLMKASISPMQLKNRMASMRSVSKFDVECIGIEALMFQTGYLTIAEEQQVGHHIRFKLDFPNLEVELSLNEQLLGYLSDHSVEVPEESSGFMRCLEANDFSGFAELLRAYLSAIPYQWHASGDLAQHEAWYAGLLHMCLRSNGVDVRVEDASNRDRADMVVLSGGQVFILEFRMANGDDAASALDLALSQMRERGYAEKYRDRGEPIHLIGVACGREAKNLLDIRVERA